MQMQDCMLRWVHHLPLHVDPCAALTTPCKLVLRGTLEVVLGAKRHKQGRNTWGGDGEAQVVSIS